MAGRKPTADTHEAIAAWRAARGLPGPDAMAGYLDGALAEAHRHLSACATACAAGAGSDRFTAPLAALAGEVAALRHRFGGGDGRSRLDGRAPAVPAMTRAALRDVERATLVDEFRERCAGLPSRLADPDAAQAALAELQAALRVLARALCASAAA